MAFKLFFFLLKKCNFFFHHFEEQWGLVCSICSGSTLSLNYDKYLIASVFFCYSHIYSKCGWMGMTTRISPWRDHHCDRIKLNARILEPHLYESIANKWSFALFHTDRHTHTHWIKIVIRLVISYTDFNTHPVFACISIIPFVLSSSPFLLIDAQIILYHVIFVSQSASVRYRTLRSHVSTMTMYISHRFSDYINN